MYQGLRAAVKDSEASVAIIALPDENIDVFTQKFDSVNLRNVFIQADKSLDEELESLAPDVAVIYADDDNDFLFKAILAIKEQT